MFDGVIDLNHNNDIDLTTLKAAGITAIIHKATEGATFQDPLYASRRQQAQELGLLWGAYHFGTAAAVDQQLANFQKTAAWNATDLVALDYEENGSNSMSQAQAEQFVTSFHQQFGFWPVLYGGDLLTEAAQTSPSSPLKNCPLWFAEYTSAAQPAIPTAMFPTWSLWQYTESDVIDGVTLDRDRFNGTQAQLAMAWPLRTSVSA